MYPRFHGYFSQIFLVSLNSNVFISLAAFSKSVNNKSEHQNQFCGFPFRRPAAYCSQDIADRDDKSEPVPHLEDSVRIIISWQGRTLWMFGLLLVR